MASKKGYSRYFLILQEDEKGYALDKGKNSSGYVKLEKKSDKCKISYYAQNINPNMGTYYMVLICKDNENEKMVVLGKILMDEQGKVDMNCEHDIDNIANSKMSMQHIIGAIIAKVSNGNISPLLTGFVSVDVPNNWKQYKLINFKEERAEPEEKKNEIIYTSDKKDNGNNENSENKMSHSLDSRDNYLNKEKCGKSNQNKDNVAEPYKEQDDKVVEEVSDDSKEENIFEKYEDAIRNIAKKKDENNDEPVKAQEVEFCSLEESILRKHNSDKPAAISKKDMPVGRMGAYFKSLVYECEEVDDIGEEIPNCRWFKIPVNSIEELYDSSKFNRYTILYYPMICYHTLITPYKHFCVGYFCDDEGNLRYIVYAIPGLRDKRNQPYGGRTGFVTWIPTRKSSGYGYWVMFYDIKKCTSVVPVKKDASLGKTK